MTIKTVIVYNFIVYSVIAGKKHIKVPTGMVNQWEKFSGQQQLFLAFFVILLLCLVFIPLIKITYLDSTQVDTFTIFHKYMAKTATFAGIILLFLAGYNFSSNMKYTLNSLFGITSTTPLINVGGLLMILIALFSVSDTVTLLKQSFSSRMSMTSGYIIISAVVIIGIVRNLMVARIEHKKAKHTKEVTIKQESDDSGYEPGFEKAKKEVEGLFGEDSVLISNGTKQ